VSFDGRCRHQKENFHKMSPPIASKLPGTGGPLILMVDCGLAVSLYFGFPSGPTPTFLTNLPTGRQALSQ